MLSPTIPMRAATRFVFSADQASWAVRYQVLGQGFESMKDVWKDTSVVRKSVRAFLSTIGLSPRGKPGRPSRKETRSK